MYSTSFVFYLSITCIAAVFAVGGKRSEYGRGNRKTETHKTEMKLSISSLRRHSWEREDEYYMRILERQPYENYEKYKERIEETRRILSDLPIWTNNEYMRYAPVDISEKKVEKSKPDEEEKDKKKYRKSLQLKDDPGDMFFRNVLERRSGESRKTYNKRIEKISIVLPELQEWMNVVQKGKEQSASHKKSSSRRPVTYTHDIHLRENYITNIYQYDGESDSDYYDRILRRHKHEDAEDYSQRLSYLMNALPHLRIWDVDPYALHLPGRYTVTEIVEEVYYEE